MEDKVYIDLAKYNRMREAIRLMQEQRSELHKIFKEYRNLPPLAGVESRYLNHVMEKFYSLQLYEELRKDVR